MKLNDTVNIIGIIVGLVGILIGVISSIIGLIGIAVSMAGTQLQLQSPEPPTCNVGNIIAGERSTVNITLN